LTVQSVEVPRRATSCEGLVALPGTGKGWRGWGGTFSFSHEDSLFRILLCLAWQYIKGTTFTQVELNTVAVSMGSLSTRVSAMHRHLLQLYPSHAPCTLEQLPDHNPLAGYAAALAATQKAHCEQHNLANTAAVVFVVQPGERNAYDQHLLQQCLWTEHSVHAVRRTLHDVSTRGEIDSSGTLRCCLLLLA
jgi:hypothetical protein